MKAKDFDKKFDSKEDLIEDLDLTSGRRPNLEQKSKESHIHLPLFLPFCITNQQK